ncbi:uncharacterized protein LOC128228385 [Mya arenaria]|uniref:uncharacterized protein LOC128228385 n=1 Tax=Mya arenaria TaxID=6604 RepID=UPI0022E23529|nr:uncharacterized protein LOC128228385 [Mya arenaria]XP_052795633.1 uncharacterized protein LOC128228385 [Mya arenaria]
MQRPMVKAERHDPAYLPPSYHLQQQLQQQQQQQKQRQMAPQTQNSFPPNKGVPPKAPNTTNTSTPVDAQSIESQIDFQSIKGAFGWTVIDNIHIPYILRVDKQFVSVRIVEQKLLSRYPNSYPDDLGKHAPLTSFFITQNEAKLLNEINIQHCDSEYGKKEFVIKDLIVLLSDFIRFYDLVKKTFPDAAAARAAQMAAESAGWLQIKNTVTPYVKRVDGNKYVPLSVIQYAAGLLVNEKVSGLSPTVMECQMLNESCKKAGVEFVFSDTTTRLISLKDIKKTATVDIIELPSSNPLKHATYMELPTNTSQSDQQSTKPNVPQKPPSSHAYVFQPTSQLDIFKAQIQSNLNNNDGQSSQRISAPPRPGYQGVPMFDARMMNDPRVARYGPPNISVNPNTSIPQAIPHIHPMMQHFMTMQRTPQPLHHGNVNGMDVPPSRHSPGVPPPRQSPGASSNPSPRSRPPSQSRPPSGSPLSPVISPLHNQPPPPYPDQLQQQQARLAHMNGQALQHMQTMMQMYPAPTNQFPDKQQQNQSHTPLSPTAQTGHIARAPPNANQEIPGLFSPTGTSIPTQSSQKSPHGRAVNGAPPPLVLMSSPTSEMVPNKGSQSTPRLVTSTVSTAQDQRPVPAPVEAPRPTNLVSAKPDETLDCCIKGAWLHNKSISCLFVEKGTRSGQYCLVEAVCKLYFNGCSVNEFLFALENVLNVPLIMCTDAEEKAFIQYYSLPVRELKCNKMITFKDLEKYFPQLSYMFPSKEAIAQSEKDIDCNGQSDVNLESENLGIPANGMLTPEDIEASMPVSAAELSRNGAREGIGKRPVGTSGGPPSKQPRTAAAVTEEDTVIILD